MADHGPTQVELPIDRDLGFGLDELGDHLPEDQLLGEVLCAHNQNRSTVLFSAGGGNQTEREGETQSERPVPTIRFHGFLLLAGAMEPIKPGHASVSAPEDR